MNRIGKGNNMKKYFISIFLIIICLISTNVYAECSYAEIVEVGNDAAYVTAGYSYAYDDKGNVSGFELSIYNLTEHMYVKLDSVEVLPNVTAIDYKAETTSKLITYNDTYLGIYRFQTSDLKRIIKYTFNVYSLSSYTGCSRKLKTITVIKPKKNEFSNLDICKHREVVNFYYCKKWASQEFNKDATDIEQNIRKRIKEIQGKTTTQGHASLSKMALDEVNRRLTMILISAIVAFVCLFVILICTARISYNNKNTI